MSLENIKSKTQSEKGFTIVELLIVVVVIAILAAITIVSYNGITSRANASAAASAAATVQKKAELYASDGPTGKYPATFAGLTSSPTTPSDTFYLQGIANGTPASGNGKSTIQYFVCGTSSTATATSTTITGINNVTGGIVRYFDYDAGTGTKPLTFGQTTGTVSISSTNYNVNCASS